MSAVPAYSQKEEMLNALSHGAGVIFSIYVLWDLLTKSQSSAHITSALIYGASLFLLFLASTLYHSSVSIRARAFYKKCDHCAIYILIAGTYTPFLVLSLSGMWSVLTLLFIWSLAIGGLCYKLLVKNQNKRVSLATYLLMGWFAVAIVYPLYLNVDVNALWWLLSGGLFYSLGTIFYSAKERQFSHAIWHVFVILGCVCHYVSITNYIF
ncbi:MULTISPECIES: hemolysin III family protein [unclassified Pseudoalteromonas]|uniref:PAQR family membrane homeostasis protein TrhA n=1 Tax=unclassified Pseudoalteromonas TaxID=194690 RepID=UPI0025B508CE|nr:MULTISPECIES: hemolysin III family protein [unclassified Pseudoalteromonas]MDN3379883.1 hemolysin III family protein [Pseudoalteromonas sp. APC 3893]MDN3388222.1 hemolysin III family protein [Pseudoalteromonas sp. APC 4017]